ncbi:MAG: hypothetical protein AAGI68_13455 [Planctomycetota bacterium]
MKRLPRANPEQTLQQRGLRLYARILSGIPFGKTTRLARNYKTLKEFESIESSYGNSPPPEWLSLRTLQLSFSDIVRPNQAGGFYRALDQLVGKYGSDLQLPRSLSRENYEKGELQSGTWRNIGFINFAEHHRVKWCESAWVQLYELHPSLACITIHVQPSDIYHQKFSSIINNTESEYRILESQRPASKGFSIRHIHNAFARRDALTRLRLQVDHEVSSILRRFLPVEWSSRSFLPCVDCLGFRILGTPQNDDSLLDIYTATDRSPNHHFNYRNANGFEIDDRSSGRRDHNPTLISITIDEKRAISRMRTQGGYVDDDHRLMYALHYNASSLALIAAHLELLRRAEDRISKISRKLSRLNRKRSRSFFGRTVFPSGRLLSDSNVLYTDLLALRDTLESNRVASHLRFRMTDYHLSDKNHSEDKSYARMISQHIDRRYQGNLKSAEILNNSIRDHVSAQTESHMYFFSMISLFIAFLGLVAFILSFVLRPE